MNEFAAWMVLVTTLFMGFCLVVVSSDGVKKLFTRREHPALSHISGSLVKSVEKPRNQYTDYTVEELETRKRNLEKEYAETLDYPSLRQTCVREIKEILDLLEWHYDRSGTRHHLAQKEKTRRELAAFDEQYRSALKGGQ